VSSPSKREVKRRLDDLAENDYSDLDPLTLADVIAHDTETVDEEAGIVRIIDTGELRKQGNVDEEIMAGLKEVHGDP
jgi:hypothetical protein